MLGRTYADENCSAARALESVGERWSLLIIRDALFRGMTRFSQFERSLGIAPNVLAARLEHFTTSGIMESQPSATTNGQREYILTDKGRDLLPVLVALTRWGDRWAAPAGPPIEYRHSDCQGRVEHRLICGECGATVGPSNIEAVPVSEPAEPRTGADRPRGVLAAELRPLRGAQFDRPQA